MFSREGKRKLSIAGNYELAFIIIFNRYRYVCKGCFFNVCELQIKIEHGKIDRILYLKKVNSMPFMF